ncbi:MerR family transcriptional regulator [Streptomyces sp. S4.7]|uniref:MerR family transcriptional regulator n=1 Tax=Streptomyces sp. S4.7 TaxID=2705439 RepID=UPI001EF25E4B|nr:MerR family transcriptional regulator [Streptomyces sp. S4.7]
MSESMHEVEFGNENTYASSGAPVAVGLSTGAVARRLGVSPTTLRSWDRRYGLGPAARQDGRHRRWTPGDVATLEEMCRLTAAGVPPAEAARAVRDRSVAPAPPLGQAPTPTPAPALRRPGREGAPPLGDVRVECRGLSRAAVRLDAPVMEKLLSSFVEEYGLVRAWENVMMPTLRAVGRRWASAGDKYVEVEHLLSWHISSAVRRVPAGPPLRTDAGPVMLACVPGEQHTLPIEALTAALSELGLPTRMFGAAVPVTALDDAARRIGPRAVVLWSQSRSTASRPLAQHIAAASWGVKGARRSPEVVLAGPGWAGLPLPGLARVHGLREAVVGLAGLYGAEPAALMVRGPDAEEKEKRGGRRTGSSPYAPPALSAPDT